MERKDEEECVGLLGNWESWEIKLMLLLSFQVVAKSQVNRLTHSP